MKLGEVGGVGIVTKQNATQDVPVGGEYMNVKKLGLGYGKPKLHDKKATKNTTPNKLFNLGISEDADVLYHATYEPFLKSIMANGLGGAGAQQQWEDSKPGYVYLARDPEVAESHAEANEEVPDEYIDNIVVLAVDTSKLDMDNLEDDPNVLDDDSTLAYKGVIPSNALMMAEGKRIPRKKGQPAGSKKHSDLYTDENPRGTIHGLKFATVKDAKASVNKIKRSGKKHAHKIQAAIAMEQRAKAAGKVSAAAVYRKYINAMKKKTKKMNELRIERPDPKDTLGVKRKDMPQIKSEDYNLFYAYLKKNGAKFTKDTMPASELRAMQKEFSDEGIMKQMRKNIKQGPNTKAVIVSSDGYIMDGHHRWLVALNTGSDLNVMRVNMPAFELYDLVNKFEKTYYKDMYDSVEMGETRGSIGVPLASGLVVSVFPHRPLRIKKSTPGKLRYDETLDEEIADWFADKWQNIFEKWSAKYKKSINCNNPKGFSQRAHCAGRKKKKKSESIRESFVLPQFDVEWDEAARYPEFVAIGKDAWIKLAKTGKAVTITDASDIENTDAADPDSFKTLEPAKQKRALAQLEKGSVEMPIVALYSDGFKELIAGNTRLTAMMAKDGRATVWQFEVPDEVATLAEARGTCWRGYQQKGFKKKGNRMVPNCVKEEETDSLGSQINFPGYKNKDEPEKPKKKQKPKSMYDKIVGTFTSAFDLDEGVNDPHIFKAVFLAGGPGSGKSFVAKKILGGTGLRSINSDEVYEFLMKKQGLSLDPETIFSPQGQEIRDKAKGISRKREATYLDGRLGLVIDGTGRDVSKYEVMAQKLRAIGYDLSMIYVNTSLEVAQQRNLKRERTLKPEKVEQLWNDVQQNLMKFQQIFGAGRFHIIDNSGGLEDLDRQKNFDKVYVETQRFLNTPPSKPKAKAWIQQQKEQNDAERSAKQQQNKEPDGGTTNSN